jgi:hypothetical protein
VDLAKNIAQMPVKITSSMKVTGPRARRTEKASNKFLHQMRKQLISLRENGKMMHSLRQRKNLMDLKKKWGKRNRIVLAKS